MKKLFTFLICCATFLGAANANTYYVNIGLATGNNDGSTWADAFQTFDAAKTAASGNAGVDDVYIKGSITATAAWTMSVDNYYGSFDGTESLPSQRPMKDNDGNGILESWEFEFPTTYTANVNGAAIAGSAAILDGFTITQNSTVNGGTAQYTLSSPIGQTVRNCVFSGSVISAGATTALTAEGGLILRVLGTFTNNLIEKNTVTINISIDRRVFPILNVDMPGTGTVSVIINGCVFRNNKASITSSLSSGISYSARNGYILNVVHATNPNALVTFSDCIVQNNDASFTSTAATALVTTNAGITSALTYSNSSTNESYINCVFANNKTTNLNSCMNVINGGYRKIYNCTFWNNQNTLTATSVTSAVSIKSNASSGGLIAASDVSNNVMDVAVVGNFKGSGTSTYANNLIDLSTTNTTATKGPQFKNVPLNGAANIIGASALFTSGADLTAILQSDWRINSSSYLIGKGTSTGTALILPVANKDKAGVTFTSTPSAGAYEYIVDTPTDLRTINKNSKLVFTSAKGIVSTIDGTLQVYSTTGMLLKNQLVSKHQLIPMHNGAYIVRASVNGKLFSQVIVL